MYILMTIEDDTDIAYSSFLSFRMGLDVSIHKLGKTSCLYLNKENVEPNLRDDLKKFISSYNALKRSIKRYAV